MASVCHARQSETGYGALSRLTVLHCDGITCQEWSAGRDTRPYDATFPPNDAVPIHEMGAVRRRYSILRLETFSTTHQEAVKNVA